MTKLSPTKTHLLMRLANIRPISMPARIAKAGPGNATTRRALERAGYMTYAGQIEDKGREYVAAIVAEQRAGLCMHDDNPAVSVEAGDHGQPVGPKCERHAHRADQGADWEARGDAAAARLAVTPPTTRSHLVEFRTNAPSEKLYDGRYLVTCDWAENTGASNHDGAIDFCPFCGAVVTMVESATPIVTDASYLLDGDIVLAIDGEQISPFTVREPHVIAPGLIGFTAEFPGVGPLVGPRAVIRSRFTIRPRPMPAGAVCAWFAGCGQPAEHRTPHVILGEVFTCARCHRNATAR